jgi:hypothetical protein
VEVEPEIIGAQSQGKKIKLPLNSNDKLYSDIRDLNFTVIIPILNKKAKEIDEYYKVSEANSPRNWNSSEFFFSSPTFLQQRHDAQTVSQIRDFMKKLATAQQEHASLRTRSFTASIAFFFFFFACTLMASFLFFPSTRHEHFRKDLGHHQQKRV